MHMFNEAMGSAASTRTPLPSYREIKNRHDVVFEIIQRAISLEEADCLREALELYKEVIKSIDDALRIQVICTDNPDLWEKTIVILQKIKKARREVLSRINAIQQSNCEDGPSKPPLSNVGEIISEAIVTGASYLSSGLVIGAEKLRNLLDQNTPRLINNINKAEEPFEISPRVCKTMQVAATTTEKTAQMTGYVAHQVGVGAMIFGQFLAPHIRKQGTRLLSSSFHMSEETASAKVEGLMTVGAGAIEGFNLVYSGLENSANILGQSIKKNTVHVIQHKYGEPVGEFVGDTINTVGNVFQVSRNLKMIKPRHLAKRAVKNSTEPSFQIDKDKHNSFR